MTAPDGNQMLRPGGRDYAPVIREQLRAEILDGTRSPGSEISQARVAAELGVSRGPVREAFRMLEREGLIDAQVNQRPRVAGLSVEELEHLYALRVLGEPVGMAVSIASFTDEQLDELDRLAEQLRQPDPDGFVFETWEQVHQRFHALLLAHSGAGMIASAEEWSAHTRRYRRVYVEDGRGLPRGAAEHATLAGLCRDRDVEGAARLLALHLSRAALSLITEMAPTHDPALLRAALRQVLGPAGGGTDGDGIG